MESVEFVEFVGFVGFQWRCGGDTAETIRDSWRLGETGRDVLERLVIGDSNRAQMTKPKWEVKRKAEMTASSQ